MKILVTGAKGFVGKNLCEQLKNNNEEVFAYDVDSSFEELDEWCAQADFVFNLAGVNRPQNDSEFKKGNVEFAERLLGALKRHGNKCPVMLASSQQASLEGRFGNSEYGRTKKAGEELFFRYAAENGVRVLVYRFPNLFGKWCRPNYNSVVATFCNAIANDLPYKVNDSSVQLDLVYIDDLVDEMIAALRGKEHRCDYDGLGAYPVRDGKYCYVPVSHRVSLGEIVHLLHQFDDQRKTLVVPEIPAGSFAKKLYSTYLSYLPASKVVVPLKMNVDARGSFTEVLKTLGSGQFSVNVSNPGITKGQHWHNSKWEFFIVVSGKALIKERKIGTSEVISFEVSGKEMKAVHMLPGYTHSIENLSATELLITLMWANEMFDPEKPDTYSLKV
ncbi:MAG: NAD-dependent epimerase/dehydratase family protein [Bacteroidaceae bacterium]|nr:NAD-dependent epimerase/dehydratase family protein [Bacteroidaceae bacterium]